MSVGDVGEDDEHKVDSGARMQVDADGARYSVRCSCGWSSQPSLTAVLAEAAGEQHQTLAQTRRARPVSPTAEQAPSDGLR